MSDLQLAMIVLGAVIVAGVAIFNVVQERRARHRAEQAFGRVTPDVLFEKFGRREPTLGEIDEPEVAAPPIDEKLIVAPPRAADLEAGVAPTAAISSRVDTVAVILADDPINREQLEPLLDAMRQFPTPVQVEGIVDEQWHPIESSPRPSWRELRVGLQLASRQGPLAEADLEAFNEAIAQFASSVNGVSQREAPSAAAARAQALDRFCAEADIEVAVNVIGRFGATFALSRVKVIALDHGLSETASGALVRFGRDGSIEYSVRRLGDETKPAVTYTNGLTIALDVPQVADGPSVLTEMIKLAQDFAAGLGGQIVDDNRKPLTDQGFASIRRTLEKVIQAMEAEGVPPGSALARRLFS